MLEENSIKRLSKHRDRILKAEIAGLLFNLGKTHIGIHNRYWANYNMDENKIRNEFNLFYSRYREYLEQNIEESIDNTNIKSELVSTRNLHVLKFLENEDVKIHNLQSNIYNIMHHIRRNDKDKNNKYALRKILFEGCERINSGIDKGYSPKQLRKLWIANVFGSFQHHVNLPSFDSSRRAFLEKLNHELSGMNLEWRKLRNFIFLEIKNWYSNLLSDTRFPMNDVTLWDQAYMTASMFKAALSAMVLNNQTLTSYVKHPFKIRWSILGIQYDKLALTEKALRVHFIHGYREITKNIDQEVKELLELEYAIGNEIYRDESGIYFIVPENIVGNQLSKEQSSAPYFYTLHPELKEVENKIIAIFSEHLKGELYPAILLTEPSRGTMNLAYLIRHAKEHHKQCIYPEKDNEVIDLTKLNTVQVGRGICQVCRIRIAEHRQHEILLCVECEKRMHQRTTAWIDHSNDETIWTGEVQDRNGRIALITLKFEMYEWLNGNLVNSLLMNQEEWNKLVKESLKEMRQIGKISDSHLNQLKSILDPSIHNRKLKEICQSIILERTIGDEWESFLLKQFPGKIDFQNRDIRFNNDDYQKFLDILLQFLLRKNPSPARLRRIWESTQAYFDEIKQHLVSAMRLPFWRCQRLVWEFPEGDLDGKHGLYHYGGLDFWVSDHKVYLITSIEKALPHLVKYNSQQELRLIFERFATSIDYSLFNKSITIYKDKAQNNEAHSIELSKGNVKPFFYKPFFSILGPSPISWQFAIPADRVPDLIRSVHISYRRHFKYVYGKLPLHIGVVVQPYKSPLYVGIQALRKIRRDIGDWNHIEQTVQLDQFLKEWDKTRSGISEECKYSDYSLYRVNSAKDPDSIYEFYLYPEQGSQEKLLPLSKIINKETDNVVIYPNTFDFEFLDTGSRKNEIMYRVKNGMKRFVEMKQNRPYTWGDWERFEEFSDFFGRQKFRTKIHHLVELVYAKLQDWEGNVTSIKSFVSSAFINVLDIQSNDDEKDRLARILGAQSWSELQNVNEEEWISRLNQFIDMFEFWHTALKQI